MAEPRPLITPAEAERMRPQARTLARARGIDCVEVDLEVIRGAREPELMLFPA
jgi:hypothetical protein